jgi:DNA-binding MarR family transcriptional regulator
MGGGREPHDPADIEAFVGAVTALVTVIRRGQARAFDTELIAVTQLLADGRSRPPSEIADALGAPRSSITRRIQALQRTGRVEIHRDPEDGRSYRVAITPAGRRELRELVARGLDLFARWVSDWTTEEVRAYTALTRRLVPDPEPLAGPRPTAWWRESAP